MLRLAATSALTCTVLANPQQESFKLWQMEGVDDVKDGDLTDFEENGDSFDASSPDAGSIKYADFCEKYGGENMEEKLFGGKCPDIPNGGNCFRLKNRDDCKATEYCREKDSKIPNLNSDEDYVCEAFPNVNQHSDDFWCKVLSEGYKSNQGCKLDKQGMTFKGQKREWSKPNGPSGTYCGDIKRRQDCYMMAPCSWDAASGTCLQDRKEKKKSDRTVRIRDLASIDDGFDDFKAALNLAVIGSGNGAACAGNVATIFPGLFKGVGLVNGVMNKELMQWQYLGWLTKHNMAYSPQHLKEVPLVMYNGQDELENSDKMVNFWEDIGGLVTRVQSKAQSALWPSYNFCKDHDIDNVDDKNKGRNCDYVANSYKVKLDLPAYMLPKFFKDVELKYGAAEIELSDEKASTAMADNMNLLEKFHQEPFCREQGLAGSCSEIHMASYGLRFVPEYCKENRCNAIMLLADCEQANPSEQMGEDSDKTVGEAWLATSGFMEHAIEKEIILVMPMTAKDNSEKNGCWNIDGYAKTPGHTIDLDYYNTGFNRQYQVLMSIATAIQHNVKEQAEEPKQAEPF